MTTRLYLPHFTLGTPEVELIPGPGRPVAVIRWEPLDVTVNTAAEAREHAQAFITAAGLLENGELA